MDFLGDSSDDDASETLSLQQCLATQLLVQIAQLHASCKRDMKLALITDDTSDILISELQQKLLPLKWLSMDVLKVPSCADNSTKFDILLDVTSSATCESTISEVAEELEASYGHVRDGVMYYTPVHWNSYHSLLRRSGYLLLSMPAGTLPLLPVFYYRSHTTAIVPTSNVTLHVMYRFAIDCNTSGAPYWGACPSGGTDVPLSHLANEMKLLEVISVHPSLSSVSTAAEVLSSYGVLLLPNLFSDETIPLAAGRGALEDYSLCNSALATRGIDPLRPSDGPAIPNYFELSMREKGRCDMRNTPSLQLLTPHSATLTSNAYEGADDSTDASDVLRRNEFIRSVLSQVMDTKREEHFRGNWGRWNFEKGGPDADIEITAGKIGAVVSLPGCEDQTIHADTSHLFSGDAQLPAHYVNLFIPTVAEKDNHLSVGQTAFIATSHMLSRCDWFMNGGEEGELEMMQFLVRPHLQAGDALLFDCRVLHFGLGNKSNSDGNEGVIRPLLYVNYHHTWFNDPKNWNNRIQLLDSNSNCEGVKE